MRELETYLPLFFLLTGLSNKAIARNCGERIHPLSDDLLSARALSLSLVLSLLAPAWSADIVAE